MTGLGVVTPPRRASLTIWEAWDSGKRDALLKGGNVTFVEKREGERTDNEIKGSIAGRSAGIELRSLKSIDRHSLRRSHSKFRLKRRKYLRWIVWAARNQEERSTEMKEAREERGG